jgi:eukaryotic-like serine/threonine-protein kinase
MATVFLGSLQGALGFRQLVAIKRPHPHLLEDHGFRDALLREARLAASIHHANVVDVRDVEAVGDAVQLVMDYIEGASLGELVGTWARAGKRLPPGIAVRIVLDACAGLHAAHEAVDDGGELVGLVHRDVSPQNVLVGVDGIARVTDFGIAKCIDASDPGTSRETLKGKAGYMAPEYVRGRTVDRRADVFALGVVLWEALSGKRLFRGQSDAETLERVLSIPAPLVSEAAPEVGVFDAVVARALEKDPPARFATTEEMARAVADVATAHGMLASAPDVGRFVREVVGDRLEERRRALRAARPGLESTPPPRLELVAPSSPGNESTTVPERRVGRSWGVRGAVVAGVLLLAGVAVVVVVRHRTPPAPAVEQASQTSSSVQAPAPASTDLPPAAAQPPSPAAPSDAPVRSRPARGGWRSPARVPPPNPYPTGP